MDSPVSAWVSFFFLGEFFTPEFLNVQSLFVEYSLQLNVKWVTVNLVFVSNKNANVLEKSCFWVHHCNLLDSNIFLYWKELFLAILSQQYSTCLFLLSSSEIRYIRVQLAWLAYFAFGNNVSGAEQGLSSPAYSWGRVSVFRMAVESKEMEVGTPRHFCLYLPLPDSTCNLLRVANRNLCCLLLSSDTKELQTNPLQRRMEKNLQVSLFCLPLDPWAIMLISEREC